ncbi:MAG: hypothetical protein V2A64_05795 [Candidatus Omnitrophota bacterium]
MVYLFIGEDSSAKNVKLAEIKKEFLPRGVEDFNLDILYSRELNLKKFQERLLVLPVYAKKRIIIIKETEYLKEDIKQFITEYVKKPAPEIILILDAGRNNPRDEFLNSIIKYARLYRFKETVRVNTFDLSREITFKRAANALRVLNTLLKDGEKPERILGGLRYLYEKTACTPLETKKRLGLLVDCDSDIKTGRLRSDFALERLILRLCSLTGRPG